MIQFQYPHILYCLLIVPILVLIFIYGRYRRKRQLRVFGRPEVIARLMPDVSKYMPWVKLTMEMLAIALIVVMLARPMATVEVGGGDTREDTATGMEIMLCVDVSNSMLASSTDDADGISRMQRTRLLLEKLIDRLGNDKVGLIVFAGESYMQLPITPDFISAKMFVNSLDPGMVPTQGTAIGTALGMAANSFTPGDEFPKAIVVITDGEDFGDDAVSVARSVAKEGIRVDVIGVGSETPVPILVPGRGPMVYDGETVMTALNVDEARKIADAGGGIYISGNDSDAARLLADNLGDMSRKEYTRISHSPAAEQFPVLAWVAFVLLVIDVFIVTRKISWLRKINFFSKDQ